MNIQRCFLIVLLAYLCLAAGSCAQTSAPKPALTLSATRIPSKGWVAVKGTGFTPKANVSSHLRKPNGTEFPVLPMLSNERGEISHEIDTLLLDLGTHALWIVDDTTQVSSDAVQFEVTPN